MKDEAEGSSILQLSILLQRHYYVSGYNWAPDNYEVMKFYLKAKSTKTLRSLLG